jgi:WD40 repeat-containing protein SMU1
MDAAAINVEIESQDVLRLILQFLKENNLISSMKQLQHESGVALNTVDNLDIFVSDIRHGKWDAVLYSIVLLKLPGDKLVRMVTD